MRSVGAKGADSPQSEQMMGGLWKIFAIVIAILGALRSLTWLYGLWKNAAREDNERQRQDRAGSVIASEKKIQEGRLITQLLMLYYPDSELRAHDLHRYSFTINGRLITTNIASRSSWLNLRLPVNDRERDRFPVIQSAVPLPAVSEDEERRIRAELAEKQVRFDDRPIFTLRSFTPNAKGPIASFSLAEYKNYKLSFGLLEEELIQALVNANCVPLAAFEQRNKLLLGRNKFLKDCRAMADYSTRLCAGGTNVLLAFRRSSDDDYVFHFKRRSRTVSTGRGVFSLLPSGMHQPEIKANAREESPIAATVYRETLEELFGGIELEQYDGHLTARRYRSAEQLRWFQQESNFGKFVLQIVSFGLNLFDGTFEFGVLLAVTD
ncbi:MAG: hypothetical protein ABSD96_19895, partial [Candidatus Korobacteraceae bacterium]